MLKRLSQPGAPQFAHFKRLESKGSLTVVLIGRRKADVYLEKDVGCWLPAHQLPQQVHRLKYNFDSILENVGPNYKSKNSCYSRRNSWQCVEPPTRPTQTQIQRDLEFTASYLEVSEVLSNSQSEFCCSARAHHRVWSLKRMYPLMWWTGQYKVR